MYAIVTVIYGIPLNANNKSTKWSDELEDAIDNEEEGFISPYSGSSEKPPVAFGIPLDSFNEACHHVELTDVHIIPTSKEISQFDELWNKLPETLQLEIAQNYGHPRIFFLWSTS